ncbi:HD domain-containing protein [Edwardsiella tarda]|uniref:HD domain-containing protein n=1 Tax=Edwardsiella tarda TaxID=636 RepID=UPI000D507C22|nr:HD domain-containing protein [Edwardsiella tarda]UCQ28409.1 HD domain-containing protein [Edwardsiella tarda]
MSFDKKLIGKILDPIHGTIMITDIERQVIGHRLFQRLRSVKQNTFLYKVFPSAMHSRFEHSLGVMHVAYLMFNNLCLNSYRYVEKYNDGIVFPNLDKIDNKHIQELRLAALLHDVGHGPMSHQFDSFLMSKTQLCSLLGDHFSDIYDLIKDENSVEHEHISLVFIRKIFQDLELEQDVSVDNVIKLIESKYKGGKISVKIENSNYDIQPLFTSLISSCPIDADRMDYLLRDSYFSGVKCGLYNIERLLKSIVPVLDSNKICLAYKESCLDSISEFIFSRSNLFSQVYYHKTNRAFSAMLAKVCELALNKDKENLIKEMYQLEDNMENYNLELLQEFYLDNSDDEFINMTVPKLVNNIPVAENLVNDIVDRKPWKKLYESKLYYSSLSILDSVNKEMIGELEESITTELNDHFKNDEFIIDIMSDNAFKDINKTEIKLLIKTPDGKYCPKNIYECGDKLNMHQTIRYFIRVFVNPNNLTSEKKALSENLDKIKETIVTKNSE